MNKEFAPYEPSLVLKELGFDEPCFGYYNYNGTHFFDYKPKTDDKNLTKAPLYQQAFRWFREKYGYYYPIHRTTNNTNQVLYSIGPYAGDYFTYEEAELACLKKLIEIVKQ